MGYIVLGFLKIKFKFDSITSHEPVFDLAGSVYTEFGLESDIQYNPSYSILGVISPVFRLASITKHESYVNCIVVEGNIALRLRLTSEEEDGLGKIRVGFSLQSDIERGNVFGPIASNLTINLSASQGDCAYDQHLLGISSYSPRLYNEPNLLLDLSLGSFVYPSNKKFVEFYESNNFINDTSLSGGIKSENQLPDISDGVILPDFSYMSKNYPFLGQTRIRKIFAKNISGYNLRYMHIGIDYPLVALNDINLITIGTAIDVYDIGKWGYTSTGLILDSIPEGFLYDDTILEVEYKQYAGSVIWVGQLVKLSDGFGYTVFCAVSSVTVVDGTTALIKLNSLEEIKKPLIGGKTLLIGLRTVSDINIDESVPIWLLNIIPFNASEVENQRVRLFAQGVL